MNIKGCTREFLYNYITALACICIEIPAYTLYIVAIDEEFACRTANLPLNKSFQFQQMQK